MYFLPITLIMTAEILAHVCSLRNGDRDLKIELTKETIIYIIFVAMINILAIMMTDTKEMHVALALLFVTTIVLQLSDMKYFRLPKAESLVYILTAGIINSLLQGRDVYLITLTLTLIGTLVLIWLPVGIADIYVGLSLIPGILKVPYETAYIMLGLVAGTVIMLVIRSLQLKNGNRHLEKNIAYVPILVNALPLGIIINSLL